MRKIPTFLLIALLILPGGCHSLRKKFTRKKKYEKEPPVYIDFKDYPSSPSREDYINYYLFVRGWLDDFKETLHKGISHKRAKRAVNEAIMNFQQIISFFNEEGKEEAYPLYEELLDIKKQVERIPNMSVTKRNSVARKVENLKRRFEQKFSYTDAKKWMN